MTKKIPRVEMPKLFSEMHRMTYQYACSADVVGVSMVTAPMVTKNFKSGVMMFDDGNMF